MDIEVYDLRPTDLHYHYYYYYYYYIPRGSNDTSLRNGCHGDWPCRVQQQRANKVTWSESPMTSSETRGARSSESRDTMTTGSSGGGGGSASLHGSVTVSIVHNIDPAGLYNEVRQPAYAE